MKFTKIRLIGLYTTELPIEGALPSDPYILKAADGLGPPEIEVALAETLNAGSVYQGSRPQSREPVLRIGLNPDHGVGQTASEMRTSLYGLLTPGSAGSILLELLDGSTVVATTVGYTKKLEINPFSEEAEVQVTIACTHSYLQAPNDLYLTPSGSQSAPQIMNSGTAPTGFRMEVIFTSNLASWSIVDATGKTMTFVHSFLAGDKLAFDTRAGQRGIWRTRDLVTTKILASLTADSVWHTLYGGVNTFTTSSPNYTWGDVYFRPQYWGI